MKLILTILFFVLLGSVRGQADSIKYHVWWSDDSVYRYQKYDTFGIRMLCSDTIPSHFNNLPEKNSKIDTSDYEWHDNARTFIVKGYEVRQNHPSFDSWEEGDGLGHSGWRLHPEHFTYLDDKRKPITYLVWDYKNIKP